MGKLIINIPAKINIKNIYVAPSMLFVQIENFGSNFGYFMILKSTICYEMPIFTFYSFQKQKKPWIIANFRRGVQTNFENISISKKMGETSGCHKIGFFWSNIQVFVFVGKVSLSRVPKWPILGSGVQKIVHYGQKREER